jgi:putative transcriptional regulator
MSRIASSSPALPIAHVALRILIVLNWLMGAAILGLLVVIPNQQWIMAAFKLSPSPDAERLIMGLRAIAVIGLAAVPLHYVILKRLLAMVETVRSGNPFVAANASRLQAIAWALLALQLLSLVVGAIAKTVSTPAFRSTAGLPYYSRFCWPACSRKAHSCAKTLKGQCDMAIAVKLDDLLYDRRMTLTELADRVGMTLANLSILKTGKARAIRFSTLDAICEALSCQPGDILRFEPEPVERESPTAASKQSTS